MKNQLIVGSGEVYPPKQEVPEVVEGDLLLLAPFKNGLAAAQQIREGLGQHGEVLDILAGDHEKSMAATDFGDVDGRD